MMRTIVIGDIHGCYDELIALLHKVDLRADDRLVAVGDLTVKGPKSREVLDLFSKDVRFSSVIGNHDLALVKHWRGEGSTLKPSQEAAWKQLEQSGEYYFQYLNALPFKADLGLHIVVHAGLRPGVPLVEQTTRPTIVTTWITVVKSSPYVVGAVTIYDGTGLAEFVRRYSLPGTHRGMLRVALLRFRAILGVGIIKASAQEKLCQRA